MGGTAIAQAIPLLASPVLSRLFSPDDFGVLALYMSIATILSVIATGRYEMAVMLPEEKSDALSVLILSALLSVAVALFTLAGIWIFHDPIVRYFDEPSIGKWLWLLPVIVMFSGWFQGLNYWSTRLKTFRLNATSRVSQSVTSVSLQLLTGTFRAGSSGLITGYAAGILIRPLVLARNLLKEFRGLRAAFNREQIVRNAKRYKNFPRINTPHAFLGSLQDNGIVYVIAGFFAKTVLGSYSFAFRVVRAPAELISSSVSQVFYQKASAQYRKGENIRPLIITIYKNMALIGLPFFGILAMAGPALFSWIFGEEWSVAGEIARILTPWLFFNFLAAPVSSTAIIANKQKEAMLITLADIALRVTALVIGGLAGSYRLAFLLMSVSCSALLIFALSWYYRIGKPSGNPAY